MVVLSLALAWSASASYVVEPTPLTAKPVSPLLMGSQIELQFGRSDQLWAEMLFDRDFEEGEPVKNGWLQYGRAKPELEDWWHSGYEEPKWTLHASPEDKDSKITRFKEDWPLPAHGDYAMRVENKSSQGPVVLAQDGLYVRKGIRYHFSGYFSQGGLSGDKISSNPVPLRIELFREGDYTAPVSSASILANTLQPNKFEVDLPATEFDGRATFGIEVPKGKSLIVDCLSLMPSDNVAGWRKDVVEAMRTQIPAAMTRFPGGCFASKYNWRDGVGKREDRPVTRETFWGGVLVNDVGTVEFVDLCRAIGTLPAITVPVMRSTATNAADWVAFCNQPHNPLRTEVGRPAPLNVKYWELDNEPYRRFDALTYAQKCREFAIAMKKVDPSIKVAMGNYWAFHPKTQEMLAIAGMHVDYLNNRGGDLKELAQDVATVEAFNHKHGTHIQVCHTEVRAPLTREHQGVDGLNAAPNATEETMFNLSCRWSYGMNLLELYLGYQRLGGDFAFGQFCQYGNGWGECLLNAAKEGTYLSSPGVAWSLLKSLPMDEILKVQATKADGDMVVQCAWNKRHTRLTVMVLNFHSTSQTIDLDLKRLGRVFRSHAKGRFIAADPKAFNRFDHAHDVRIEANEVTTANHTLHLDLSPTSATAVELEVSG